MGVSLANYFADRGAEVTLLVFRRDGPLSALVQSNVTIRDLATRKRNPYRQLASALKQLQPHTVLSMYRKSNTVAGLSRLWFRDYRLVLREANTLQDVLNKPLLRRWKNLLKLRFAYRLADGGIANTHSVIQSLQAHGIAPTERFKFVANPVDSSAIYHASQSEIEHPWLEPDQQLIPLVTAGRLHTQKNQNMLLHAFAMAANEEPGLHLIILGEGPLEAKLRDTAMTLQIADRVDFIGFQKNPYPWYRAARLFILPSNREGFPNVLLEALACGTAVIATDCPGESAFILNQGQYGQLVPPNDAEAMSQAILRGIQPDPDEAIVAQQRQARAFHFNFSTILPLYQAILFPNSKG